jgi:hypothetical protein
VRQVHALPRGHRLAVQASPAPAPRRGVAKGRAAARERRGQHQRQDPLRRPC